MKHYLLFCLLLCASWKVQAQKLHVVYEYIPSAVATFREHVYYENGIKTAIRDSISVKASKGEEKKPDEEVSSSFSLVLNTGINYRKVVIQSSDKNELQETRSVKKTNYLVTDQFPGLVWNTDYKDTDTLGKFVCHKATASYRGTRLVAYYTNDIPVPAGPYKFGGLPGLIVMLYNEGANPNYWMLQEVSYPYEGSVPLDKKYIYSLPKLTLEDYIKKEDAQLEEQMRIMESKMPPINGVTVERKKVRGTVEQIYEWEQKGPSEK
ncbi:GLPGLI family protein [Pedobacter africanus]|uniref:GLPGLI family protein n=1 Tax=Pedobacter africanus TaxID=151894 RepID=A0ACC6KS91_9SPHI|nr:GLPGLI family protein [Pedobacter africanus]MDR6781966.1 GLPGLI family protein [Pedobacter africanus]